MNSINPSSHFEKVGKSSLSSTDQQQLKPVDAKTQAFANELFNKGPLGPLPLPPYFPDESLSSLPNPSSPAEEHNKNRRRPFVKLSPAEKPTASSPLLQIPQTNEKPSAAGSSLPRHYFRRQRVNIFGEAQPTIMRIGNQRLLQTNPSSLLPTLITQSSPRSDTPIWGLTKKTEEVTDALYLPNSITKPHPERLILPEEFAEKGSEGFVRSPTPSTSSRPLSTPCSSLLDSEGSVIELSNPNSPDSEDSVIELRHLNTQNSEDSLMDLENPETQSLQKNRQEESLPTKISPLIHPRTGFAKSIELPNEITLSMPPPPKGANEKKSLYAELFPHPDRRIHTGNQLQTDSQRVEEIQRARRYALIQARVREKRSWNTLKGFLAGVMDFAMNIFT